MQPPSRSLHVPGPGLCATHVAATPVGAPHSLARSAVEGVAPCGHPTKQNATGVRRRC